ncbi:MAG: response regulator transcription factor [Saprospiraceae bacterium]|nr:response regulator transcription factor [Saprospiraceae bacterium]
MTIENKIKLAIVDDHEIFRSGLIMHLSKFEELEIIVNVEKGNELLAELKNHQIDIILLDLSLPDISGIEIIKFIRSSNLKVKILALTGHEQSSYVFNALDAKVDGYLLKTAKASEILIAIKIVIANGNYFSDIVKNIIATDVIRKHNNDYNNTNLTVTFSGIEKKVLKLIRDGKTSEAIAKELFKSKRTIDEYRSQLMKKTKTHNSTELMFYCIANKIFET